MARAKLGDRFDIHTASVDLIFPHNENELAESRALTGESPARFWLHSELVLAKGKKMAYGQDNCVVLPDLIQQGYSPREVRFFLLQTYYRQPVWLTDEMLDAARASLRRLDECVAKLAAVVSSGPRVPELEPSILAMKESLREAIFDDMNISAALAALFRLVRQTNYLLNQGRLHREDADAVAAALRVVDAVLGILPPAEQPEQISSEIQALVSQREQARRDKDFGHSDEIRDTLASRGYVVEDLPDGTRIKRRN